MANTAKKKVQPVQIGSLVAPAENGQTQPTIRGKLYVYGRQDQRGLSLVLTLLNDRLDVAYPTEEYFKSIVGKRDDEEEVFLAIFKGLRPGKYLIEANTNRRKRIKEVTVDPERNGDVIEEDISNFYPEQKSEEWEEERYSYTPDHFRVYSQTPISMSQEPGWYHTYTVYSGATVYSRSPIVENKDDEY